MSDLVGDSDVAERRLVRRRRALAGLAAAGFGLILVGSGAWLVPLQRRLVARGPEEPQADAEKLRRQWFQGHRIRATVALLSFTLSAVAVVS